MRKIPLAWILLTTVAVACQHNTRTGDWSPDHIYTKLLQDQEIQNNGIEVGEPEIYDDNALRSMLQVAEQRLATINALNEATLLSHLGATTGITSDQTQFALQVTGPSLPKIETTSNGATNKTNSSAVGAVSTEATDPTKDVVTTQSEKAPPTISTAPTGVSLTPPTQTSGSALDFLNEQMQLTYEIAGLRLMLEGSLSAKFVKNQQIEKTRTTIGFPISISPRPRFRDAVAVVEVEVAKAAENLSGNELSKVGDDPPIITALLPQEKTYNVAALTDNTTNIGAGAVIGTVGVAGNFFRAHRTLYLVQDQDTVAIQRPRDPNNPNMINTTSFAWEFKPVLGRDYVRGGQKRTFVQLSFPVLPNKGCLGAVRVRTYWRYFDKKSGISEEVIRGSVLSRMSLPILHPDASPSVGSVAFQDIGDGTVSVTARGQFPSGSSVQLGPTRYDLSNGLKLDDRNLVFVVPAAALARWTGQVVAPDGSRTDLLNVAIQKKVSVPPEITCVSSSREDGAKPKKALEDASGTIDEPPVVQAMKEAEKSQAPNDPCEENGSLNVLEPSLSPLNELETELFIPLELYKMNEVTFREIVLDIGHKVFGLSDSKVERRFYPNPHQNAGKATIKVVVPTSLLVSNNNVRIFRMFWAAPDGERAKAKISTCFDKSVPLPTLALESATQSLTLVGVDSKGTASYILYGNGLEKARVVDAGIKATLEAVGSLPKDHALLIRVKKKDIRKNTKLILQRSSPYGLLVLDLPQSENTPPKDTKPPAPPKISIDSPVVQNTDELDVSVEKPEDLTSVKMNDTSLLFDRRKDSIRLKNLKASNVTSEQLTRELVFEYKDKTVVKVKLDVVSARVGVKVTDHSGT